MMLGNKQVEEALLAVGIPAAGICAYQDLEPFLPCRGAARLPQRPQSVIVCLFPYYVGEYPGRNLSRYAIVDDYHTVTRGMLGRAAALLEEKFPGRSFVPFADSSPIREVEAARRAGLGFVGRNGLLIAEGYGSCCFIGELVTDLPLDPGEPLERGCGACRRCLDACPGGAIGPGGAIDKARCRSHITQKRGELTPWERESIRAGGLAWGCDLCTDACPHNKALSLTPIQAFRQGVVERVTEESCGPLCKTRAFGFRGPGVLRRNLRIISEGKPK